MPRSLACACGVEKSEGARVYVGVQCSHVLSERSWSVRGVEYGINDTLLE